MRITWTSEDGVWRLRLRLDAGEGLTGVVTDGQRVELATDTCHIRPPAHLAGGEVHPDLLALAAWTVAAPWTKGRVLFDRPISHALAAAFHDGWGVDAGPVGESPRAGGRLAISYSGGADSAAVATILPDAPLVHFQRTPHPRVPNRWTHYRSDVLAALARQTGRDVTVVQSDLEFLLRHPRPGYPEHHAVMAGAVLLAGPLDLGGVALGYELGSRWLGGGRYVHRYTPDNPMWSGAGRWGRLFAAAGLPLVLPAGGISEAMTMKLALGSPLREQVRWCLRGDGQGPCGRCGKCLYKELIQAAVERRPLRTAITADRPVAAKWQQPPPYGGQEMIEYGCAHVPGIETTPFARAAEHLQATPESTRWLERCYPPAVEEVPEPWRKEIEAFMSGTFGSMEAADTERVESWGRR
ncbi:DUF6395 domain-containing protein [Sphaerisporangium sp. TRM90804]|uniref:DUF6395 domain-containing protein n=1 Tax=Sphaerisporangium sp. TRM90804 TaxID=3031113 RepID=UPI0024475DAD|nr:DUF6395 domain-containing protein [Sphaerisporangium sp. TRM90804]MDH2427665.1 DUF6395 domain-containing protein [Sphaerisporangium sp. TRM90804]